eukprot:COSAG05_NODE_2406_length_3102_cov_1.630703_2_plen_46_part_00
MCVCLAIVGDVQPIIAIFHDHILGDVNAWFTFKDLKWAGFSFILM